MILGLADMCNEMYADVEHGDCESAFRCQECGKEVSALVCVTLRGGNLTMCPNCATFVARIMLQDVLSLENGCEVSLLSIMKHGRKDVDQIPNVCPHDDGFVRSDRIPGTNYARKDSIIFDNM